MYVCVCVDVSVEVESIFMENGHRYATRRRTQFKPGSKQHTQTQTHKRNQGACLRAEAGIIILASLCMAFLNRLSFVLYMCVCVIKRRRPSLKRRSKQSKKSCPKFYPHKNKNHLYSHTHTTHTDDITTTITASTSISR